MTSADVRDRLVSALRLDLIGPEPGSDLAAEELPYNPSRWYLTGFLVPMEGDREDSGSDEGLEEGGGDEGDEGSAPEVPAARRKFLPSSIGLSLFVGPSTGSLRVTARWGDYAPFDDPAPDDESFRLHAPDEPTPAAVAADPRHHQRPWRRTPREQTIDVALPGATAQPIRLDLDEPTAAGPMQVAVSVRAVPSDGRAEGLVPPGTRCVSVFLVNRRLPLEGEERARAFAFQAELEVRAQAPLVARVNTRGLHSQDWDESLADLQYRDVVERVVGHGISARLARDPDGECRSVATSWIPESAVSRVEATRIAGVELGMESLAALADGPAARVALVGLAEQYRAWVEARASDLPADLRTKRQEVAHDLFSRARVAAGRIAEGVELLATDAKALEAFRVANRAMAAAARRRRAIQAKAHPGNLPAPEWRPFQLAFVLMNLPSLVDPRHDDRETVDLLFFPTGGGKTEAYLGLAAFALVHRRLANPGLASAGLGVLMRYTLRLLTLDQLGRASTLICALERERQAAPDALGPWPFEIGLWVGRSATPNRLGSKRDHDPNTARNRFFDYRKGKASPPIPLEDCPWCGSKFTPNSYVLIGNPDDPTDLRVRCLNRSCDFQKLGYLPILTVDEPIYRRLPCFLIATVDKFAAMPWTGEVGGFFGRADRHDAQGFYGPCDPPGIGRPLPGPRLPPPDLIIQDELHLISGPMGTMVGLYETALDALASRPDGDRTIRPKIVASTATVRRAEQQIRALFDRKAVDVFPPPMPDRRDSFFAREQDPETGPPRLYLGIAAQGRSPKVMLLRAYRALLGAAWKAYLDAGGAKNPDNPADPYLTLLGYFNSLRELGGSRRIVEDEVVAQLRNYSNRRRRGEAAPRFADRDLTREVVELTSRVSTAMVAEAKGRLEQSFAGKDHVDVAMATNMISVGLDIPRLGLMVVLGQPKTCAEYIQATSRVGRLASKPGLVVTLLNIHRPRDRSHYERFGLFHQSFYRSVEATSVTPFSPRALDRGLAAATVALARLGHPDFTAARGAEQILGSRQQLEHLADDLVRRAKAVRPDFTRDDAEALRARVDDLLDAWSTIADQYQRTGTSLQYQSEVGGPQPLLRDFLDPELRNKGRHHRMFRANRSMRDVEPSVNLWVKTSRGRSIAEDAS